MRSRVWRSVVTVVVLALLTACGNDPVRPQAAPVTVAGRQVTRVDPATDDRFVIGVLLAKTGPLAAADARVLAGVESAVNALGLLGIAPEFLPELDVVDAQSDLSVATEAVGRQLDRGADVLLVGCDPDVASNAARAAARSGRLVLAPCVGDAGIDADGSLFTFGPDDDAQGRVLAEQAVAAELMTAAAVSELSPADGARVCRSFVERYRELGGRVVAELEQPLGVGADVSARNLARLERPQVVVSCVTTSSVPVLVSTLRELGIDTPVLATAAADGAGLDDPTVAYLEPAALRPPIPALQNLIDLGVPSTSAVTVLSALAIDLLVGAASDTGAFDGASLAAGMRSPAAAERAGGMVFDERQRLVPPLGLVPAVAP